MHATAIEWDRRLIEKYDRAGPRYTSYPTAADFHTAYGAEDFLASASRYPERPLSLYVHIPFCHKLCYFCGCNKQVTRQPQKAARYLQVLATEIASRAPLFAHRTVTQLHWGGGTPTFLTAAQISALMRCLRDHFTFAPDAELGIEIDPREIDVTMIDHLRQEGFNRLSMGIQDVDKTVQQRVNRVQDETLIAALIARARATGFASVSLDLIYGLPMQTPEGFAATLQQVLTWQPDRLSVFNYAHMPDLFPAQRKIRSEELPAAQAKLAILQQTIATLTGAGYQFIGMDHFARQDDALAVAQRQGELQRNFQGYSTQGECDLLGLGVSAISQIGDGYAQNEKVLNHYAEAIMTRGHALWRGVALSVDDRLRREVIQQLMCHFYVDKAAIARRYTLNFDDYFAEELALLAPLAEDGLVMLTPEQIQVSATGRLLVRNISMCFDRHLRQRQHQIFSRVI
ncbi:oxygen-independent coproporphyrinogen III oxidase [Pantoea sp. 1.19]|uniref:oxygen-independent coproporphyrinogen III oxidase n=1 Tax=Pantoea sp. 1.19 TaxID=1925589 RepID=UPI0009491F81|nr:oxygen-independent coproporphyrinogen III oxidase [Pantoea sp. 1.19]